MMLIMAANWAIACRILRHHDGSQEREEGRECILGLGIATHEDHRILMIANTDDGGVKHFDIGNGSDRLNLAGKTRTRDAQIDAVGARVHELEQALVTQV